MMGKNPSNIFRELYKDAKQRQKTISSVEGSIKGMIYKLNEEDHCYYVMYDKVIKTFLKEGYPVNKAEKHITQWIDNDMITMRYSEGYRLIGLYEDVA